MNNLWTFFVLLWFCLFGCVSVEAQSKSGKGFFGPPIDQESRREGWLSLYPLGDSKIGAYYEGNDNWFLFFEKTNDGAIKSKMIRLDKYPGIQIILPDKDGQIAIGCDLLFGDGRTWTLIGDGTEANLAEGSLSEVKMISPDDISLVGDNSVMLFNTGMYQLNPKRIVGVVSLVNSEIVWAKLPLDFKANYKAFLSGNYLLIVDHVLGERISSVRAYKISIRNRSFVFQKPVEWTIKNSDKSLQVISDIEYDQQTGRIAISGYDFSTKETTLAIGSNNMGQIVFEKTIKIGEASNFFGVKIAWNDDAKKLAFVYFKNQDCIIVNSIDLSTGKITSIFKKRAEYPVQIANRAPQIEWFEDAFPWVGWKEYFERN